VALHVVVRDVREAGGFVEMDGLNVEFWQGDGEGGKSDGWVAFLF
jgi:hypothetical protein